jgi:hypothetical protein
MKKRKIDWNKELNGLSEEEQVGWFINFTKEEGIASPSQLARAYGGGYRYFYKLSKTHRDKVFPPIHEDWTFLLDLSEEEQVKWFIKFKEDNNIKSPAQLQRDRAGLYKHFKRLSKESKRIIFPEQRGDWAFLLDLTEEEQVKWFIKFKEDNNIETPTQLQKTTPGRYYCKLSKESKRIIFPEQREDWTFLNKLEEKELMDWFIEYKRKHNIKTRTQLEGNTLLKYYYRLSKKNRKILFPEQREDWTFLQNLSEEEQIKWFTNFKKDNNIETPVQMAKTTPGKYFNLLPRKLKEKVFIYQCRDWSFLQNLSEKELIEWFIKFKKDNNIISISHLEEKEGSQLATYFRRIKKEYRDEIFPPIISLGEKTLGRLLKEAGYVFTTQKTFQDLRSNKGGVLKYDIYIEQKNCIIEFHGEQHFNPNIDWYDEEAIERDRIKYQYAINHGITIIYITDCIEAYKKYGYFTEVLTDWDELIEKIMALPDIIVDAEDTAQN